MDIYQGEELKSFVQSTLNSEFKERFILKDLHNYMTSSNDRKACCLYGLRRTGKTVMALQEMKKLNDYNNTLFISCNENDAMWGLHSIINDKIKQNPNLKYLFIDEATKISDFIGSCSFLADAYAMRGIKVVLSGTDSLGFYITLGDELLDRAHLLHTTYIPFKEYNYLLDKGIEDYIAYGGTLTDGTENVYYNNDVAAFYTNSAIADNIFNSLHNWGTRGNYALDILYRMDNRGDLTSFINKIIEYHNRTFLADVINKDFKSHDLGSLLQIMAQRADPNELGNPALLKSDELNDNIRIALGIKHSHFHTADETAVKLIIQYLKALDVLYEIPQSAWLKEVGKEKYIFTQVGMRYCQATSFAEMLVNYKAFGEFTLPQREKILETLDNDIKGGILEDIIFYQLSVENKDDKNIEILKYHNAQSQEIDAVIYDRSSKSICLIEIKHSNEQVEGQRKHLCNEPLCTEIVSKAGVPIANKVVIYLGENGQSDDGVLYINAEDFLKQSKEISRELLKSPNIAEFKQLESLINASEHKKTPKKFDMVDDD